MPDGHRIPQDANDWMRSIERRLNTIERRPAVMSREQILGEAVAPLSVQVLDWNSPDVLLNGWYWSESPAANGPTLFHDYMGVTIVRSSGDDTLRGVQRLTRSNDPSMQMYRTFESPAGGPATFGQWWGATDWITATLQPGWNHYDGRVVQYSRDSDNWVNMRGLAKDGAGFITALPPGFRCNALVDPQHHIPVAAGGAFGFIRVWNTGAIELSGGSNVWVDLSTVRYRAAQ